jgi:[ribosomal protein S5]-alanine N-acetyltransferase
MSNYILETERCLLRPLTTADCDGFYRLNEHPDIFRFTTDPPFQSIDAARKFLEEYNPYRQNGFGRWAVELKPELTFTGWCGLKFIPDENEVDVGYRFLPEFWGRGLATETGAACCRLGFHSYGLTRIVARIHPENLRSVRVAEKMNMTFEKELIYDNAPWLNYVLYKS